jgi:hypothetical protein
VIKPLLIAAALLATAAPALAPAAVAQKTVLRLSETAERAVRPGQWQAIQELRLTTTDAAAVLLELAATRYVAGAGAADGQPLRRDVAPARAA